MDGFTKQWTASMDRTARDLRAEGMSWQNIGDALGVSRKTVLYHAKQLGWYEKTPRADGDVPLPMGRYKDQLCWHCAKSGGRCAWSASGCRNIVPGWTAMPVRRKAGGRDPTPWYHIMDCPEFEEE